MDEKTGASVTIKSDIRSFIGLLSKLAISAGGRTPRSCGRSARAQCRILKVSPLEGATLHPPCLILATTLCRVDEPDNLHLEI